MKRSDLSKWVSAGILVAVMLLAVAPAHAASASTAMPRVLESD
jgi:hypothetical protein